MFDWFGIPCSACHLLHAINWPRVASQLDLVALLLWDNPSTCSHYSHDSPPALIVIWLLLLDMVTFMDHELVYLVHQTLYAGFQLVNPPLGVLNRALSRINPSLQRAVVTVIDVLDSIVGRLREATLGFVSVAISSMC